MDYSKENNKKRRKRHSSKKKRVKNKVGIVIFRVLMGLFLVAVFSLGGAAIGAYFGIIENAPKLTAIQASDDNYTTILYVDKTGAEYDRLDGIENREYVTSDQIPQYIKDAFVAIEDERYYGHDGVDYKGFARAIYQTLKDPDSPQGASTITQQVIKNKLKIRRNTIPTKIQEQYLALEYEKSLVESLGSKEKAKDKILELYLNIIALGHGQYGVQAAANYYFNKDAMDLTLAECTVISAITQNPSGYSPVRFPEKNKKRQMVALDNMLEFGMITQAEYDEAVAEDVYSKIQQVEEIASEVPSYHSYYVDRVISDVSQGLQDKFGMTSAEASNLIYNKGLSIYSPIDLNIQKIVDEAFVDNTLFPANEYELEVTYLISIKNELTGKQSHYEKTTAVKNYDAVAPFVESVKDELLGSDDTIVEDKTFVIPQPQAAMAIIDYHTGKVVAVGGGRGEKQANRGFNRSTDAKRQPGSVFKVVASFAPALDMGKITAATVIDDVPVTFPEYGNYTPKNWYSSSGVPFRGLSTVRMGIRDSMNIVTVKNMYNTGVDACYEYLLDFGFTTLVDGPNGDRNLSTALGGLTDGVTPLETAAAYGVMANQGVYNKPIFYTKVFDHDGNFLLENEPEPRQVLKPTSAFILTDMMKDVITAGTGRKAALKNTTMPIAGKTGTTNENTNLTFTGYTPYYVASVWLGYDNAKPMSNATSGESIHMALWSHVMSRVHENLEVKQFEMPSGIVTATICTQSGKLAVDGLCSSDPRGNTVRTEYFDASNVPTEACDVHKRYTVCSAYGAIPTDFCPSDQISTRVGIIRPEPYIGDQVVGDRQYEVPQLVRDGVMCPVHRTEQPIEPSEPIEGGNQPNIDSMGEPSEEPDSSIPKATEDPFRPATPPPEKRIDEYVKPSKATPKPAPTPAPTPISTPQPVVATPKPNVQPDPTEQPLLID